MPLDRSFENARKLGKHSLGLQREEERECMTLIQHGLSGQIYYYYRCYFSLNFNFTFYHPDDNFILGRYNVGKEKKEFTEFRHCRAASAYKDNMCPREIEGSRVLQT